MMAATPTTATAVATPASQNPLLPLPESAAGSSCGVARRTAPSSSVFVASAGSVAGSGAHGGSLDTGASDSSACAGLGTVGFCNGGAAMAARSQLGWAASGSVPVSVSRSLPMWPTVSASASNGSRASAAAPPLAATHDRHTSTHDTTVEPVVQGRRWACRQVSAHNLCERARVPSQHVHA